jgi:polo-like kinase 1
LPFGGGSEKQEGFEHYLNKFKSGRQGPASAAKLQSPESIGKLTLKSQNSQVNTGANLLNTIKTPQNHRPPEVWVKKWVDYSSKYGLGYMLSNNA